jgi:hypothetical protein
LKPLLHLWSLAIEEQFYLVFPLLLIVGKRFRIDALIIIAVCLVSSFLLNVIQIDEKPTEVFFFPSSRAWELLIGSLIAYLNIHSVVKNNTNQFANLLSWFGVVLILGSWFFLNGIKIEFSSWWALMPTLGAASLILAGEKAWFNRKILASRIAIFIGLISYPLYLWHWVLLSFLRITEIEKPNAFIKIAVLILSIILAWLTYYFIEKRIRFQKNRFLTGGLFLCLMSIGAIGFVIQQAHGYPEHLSLSQNFMAGEVGHKTYVDEMRIYRKICLKKYEKEYGDQYCLIQDFNREPTVLLIGDSHSNHLYSGLVQSSFFENENLLNFGAGGCWPFFDNPTTPNNKCLPLINRSLEMAIHNTAINTVVLTGRAVTEVNAKSFTPKKKLFSSNPITEVNPYVLFQNSMRKTLQRLSETQKNIVFILDIPELEFNPKSCINRPWRRTSEAFKVPCAITRIQAEARRSKHVEMVKQVLKDFPNVELLDPFPAFCDEDYCWAVKDKKMLYRDDNHVNQTGSIYLADYLKNQKKINSSDTKSLPVIQ